MSIAKRIATAKQLGIKFFHPEDPRDKATVIQVIEEGFPEPIIYPEPKQIGISQMRFDYCGQEPSGPGNYIILDILTNNQKIATILEIERKLIISLPGDESPHKVSDYDNRWTRWMRIMPLSKEESKEFR
jgi:hypothetical protein